METDILKKRWIYVVNGFIVLLFMGCSYAWSIFVVPLEANFGWVRSQTSLAFTLNILFFSVGSILVGILSNKLSFSTLLKISGLMIGIGFFTSSLVQQVWQIYITYSFLCGCGIGMGYNCVVSSVPLWFPEKTGMTTGILLMGYALSTAILGPVINMLIESMGISHTFKVLAIFCTIGLILGSILLKIPTLKDLKSLPRLDRQKGKKEFNVITSKMIRMPLFWIYFLLSGLLAGVGLGVINHASPLLTEDLALNASFAALIISALSIFNGLGRFIWGILYDQLGLKKIIMCICFFMLGATGIMILSLQIHQSILFIVAACCLMFVFGGNAAMIPTIMRELFGHRTFSLNYSVLCINCIISSMIPTVVGTLQGITKNYILSFYVLGIVMIINVLLMFIMFKLYKKDYEKED